MKLDVCRYVDVLRTILCDGGECGVRFDAAIFHSISLSFRERSGDQCLFERCIIFRADTCAHTGQSRL